MLQIPVTESGNSEFDVAIAGIIYTFYFKYNTRNQRLYVTISNPDGEVLTEMRLIENLYTTAQYPHVALPDGEFAVGSLTDVGGFATLGNTGINEDFTFVYITEQELEEAIASLT